MAAVAKLPGGKGKAGIPVTEAEDDILTRWIIWIDSDKPTGAERSKYEALTTAVRAELAQRRKPKEPPPAKAQPQQRPPAAKPAEQTALAVIEQPGAMEVHDPKSISNRFAELKKHYHLVAPATHVDVLPEGFGVSMTFVSADPNSGKDGPGDVYSTGKKVGLSGHVIQQIGAGLGIEWDPRQSGRLDNGSDPRYVHYRAVGWVKNFDGTPRQIMGEVEIDMRDGSDQVNEFREKAKKRAERYPNDFNDGGDAQILEVRKFILRHAETKAQLRAIARSMGLKRSYHPSELKKPFAIARLTFTGQSDDPELRREFARMNAAAAINGARSLYGPPPAPALPPAPELHGPPPLGNATDADFDEPEDEGDDEGLPFDDTISGDPAQAPAERMREPGDD